MVSIVDIAPDNEIKAASVAIQAGSKKHILTFGFYSNRIAGRQQYAAAKMREYDRSKAEQFDDGDDADDEGLFASIERAADRALFEAALAFCHGMASWDLTGPLTDAHGRVVWESTEQPIPLEPDYVQHVQPWLRNLINDKINETIYPNLKESRNLLRRS